MKQLRIVGPLMTITLSAVALIGLSGCASAESTSGAPASDARARLAPCPETPNCVSTQSPPSDQLHYIAPIPFTGAAVDANRRMVDIVRGMPRTSVITAEGDYLHVEFRSRIFRFVDDVEFYFDGTAGLIHFRSAARMGRSDLGVNRRRMEEIRERFVAE